MTHRPDSAVAVETGSDFKPHPDGQHVAVCVDVINLGLKAEEYQGKPKLTHKVSLVWRTGEKRDDGEYFEVSKELTLSMAPKSNLRPFLTAWRGKSFTDEEAQKFDVANLHGAPAIITIEHKVSGAGRTYANVIGITKLMKGLEVPEVGLDGYKRAEYWEKRKKEYAEGVAKRRAETAMAPASEQEHPEPVEPEGEDDLPFNFGR